MHVAYIHQHFATVQGATGTRSYEMSLRLIRAGHQVTLICGAYAQGDRLPESSESVTQLEVDGIRVLRVAEPYGNEMGFTRRLIAFGRFARRATRLVRGLDADLVFATSTPLSVGIPGMKGARRLGVPFVFEVRDLWPKLAIAMGVLRNPVLAAYARNLERRIYRAADYVIALAPGIKNGVCETGYPAERVSVIPNAADVTLFRPSDELLVDPRFGASSDLKLVFTGAHGLANGLDAIIDAAAVLRRRGESGIRFVCIGTGSQKARLVHRTRAEALDDFITWLDPIPKTELAKLLPRFDVGLMILRNVSAFYDGTSPNKFFDYLAAGLPVLNNYPGWIAKLIEEHDAGFVVVPDDSAAFADAVLRLRDHRDQLQTTGANARRLAEAMFSRDALGDRFVATLEKALTRRAGR